MAKVSIELGLTLKMATGGGYNFFRPSVSISDIDIEQDTSAQIERALEVIEEAWQSAEQAMTKIIQTTEVVENEELLVEIGKRISSLESQLAAVTNTEIKNW